MSLIIIYDWANPMDNNSAILIIYAILTPVSVINIYLHLEYFIANKGVKLLCDWDENVIKYIRKGKEEIITPSIIERVEVHQSRFYKKKGGFLTTDNYRFFKFILKGNKAIVITSLLYPDFECKLVEIAEVKEKTIASILVG